MTIKSFFGDYKVSEIDGASKLATHLSLPADNTFLLVDGNVAPYFKEWQADLDPLHVFKAEAVESAKNLSSIEAICDWLARAGATKDSTLIAIGGGIIQDLATFTAAVYFRGINWIYVPSTLLSMADSCIGAKCALNLGGHKNQIGVFFAPKEVVLVPDLLEGLPDSERLSGLGEILKLSLTGEDQFFEKFKSMASIRKNSYELAKKSLVAKKSVIEGDELETSERRILNYGHSFGHAIETLSKNQISHGEAVVIGIEIMNYLGVKWGITNPGIEESVRRVVSETFPKTHWIPPVNFAKGLVEELRHDKKIQGGRIVFAVLRDVGNIALVPKDLDENLVNEVQEYLEKNWTKPSH
jgi:3-dehydroquinate synthase